MYMLENHSLETALMAAKIAPSPSRALKNCGHFEHVESLYSSKFAELGNNRHCALYSIVGGDLI